MDTVHILYVFMFGKKEQNIHREIIVFFFVQSKERVCVCYLFIVCESLCCGVCKRDVEIILLY